MPGFAALNSALICSTTAPHVLVRSGRLSPILSVTLVCAATGAGNSSTAPRARTRTAIVFMAPSGRPPPGPQYGAPAQRMNDRSEEHTSELQSLRHLVCRLL